MPEHTEQDRDALAAELFRWNTPTDPYFVINGRSGDTSEGDPYRPIADALLASDWLADHDRRVKAEALREAQAKWASEYDRITRESASERKSRAAYRMASVLAGQRADRIESKAR